MERTKLSYWPQENLIHHHPGVLLLFIVEVFVSNFRDCRSVIDSSRRTPLYYAVEKGYTKIVQTLLEYDTYMEVPRV